MITSSVLEIQDLTDEIDPLQEPDFMQQMIYRKEEEKQMRDTTKQDNAERRQYLLHQLEGLNAKTQKQQTRKGKGEFKHFSLQSPKKIPRGWIQE